jgi:hypothetical protein
MLQSLRHYNLQGLPRCAKEQSTQMWKAVLDIAKIGAHQALRLAWDRKSDIEAFADQPFH